MGATVWSGFVRSSVWDQDGPVTNNSNSKALGRIASTEPYSHSVNLLIGGRNIPAGRQCALWLTKFSEQRFVIVYVFGISPTKQCWTFSNVLSSKIRVIYIFNEMEFIEFWINNNIQPKFFLYFTTSHIHRCNKTKWITEFACIFTVISLEKRNNKMYIELWFVSVR